MKQTQSAAKRFASLCHKIPGWIYLIPILLLAVHARLLYLTKADIWHDEGYTAALVKQPIGDILSITITDVHPPLYYMIMYVWHLLFGGSVESLRGFSVVCGVATVALLFFLLQKLFSKKIAVLGAIFAAIGPFLVRYSNEARMYALAALIALAATYVFIKAIDHKKQKHWWLLYGALVAAGIYTQYFLALIIPAHFIYIWLTFGGNKKAFLKVIRNKNLWLSAGFGMLLFLPWLPIMISQTTKVGGGFWIPEVDRFSIPNTLSMFISYDYRTTKYFGLMLAPMMIAVSYCLAKHYPKKRAAIWLLTSWLLAPMMIVYLLSLRQPVYLDRYFTYSAPAFYALLAVYLCLIGAKKWWKTVIALLLAVYIGRYMWNVGIHEVAEAAWNNTNTAMSHINSGIKPGDTILSTEIYTYFNTSYYNKTGQEIVLLAPEGDDGWGEWGLVKKTKTPQIPTMDRVPSRRIWLISRTKNYDQFMAIVPKNWKLQQEFHDGDLIVGLYERG